MEHGVQLRLVIDLEDVVVHRTAREGSLLEFGDPCLKAVAKANMHGRCHKSIVGIDYRQWSGVFRSVDGAAIFS